MRNKRLLLVLSLIAAMAMILAACAQPTEAPAEAPPEPTEVPPPEPTEPPPPTEEPKPELGSAERPIQVYFVPSVEVDTIVTGGETLRQALTDATGYEFEVFVPTSYGAFVEGFCAEPEDAMGFPATMAYVVANARCGVDASMMAVRYGDPFYFSAVIVPRDSEAQTLADLNGLTWAFPDGVSTSGFIVPSVWHPAAGLTAGSSVASGGHTQTVLMVYNGEVDYGTIYYNPPQPIEGSGAPKWEYGDPLEPYADVVADCTVNEKFDLFCGDYEIKDARDRIAETAPDVIEKVRLLALSIPMPNDCLAFGPEFPADLRAEIEQAIVDLQADEALWEVTLKEIYNYSSMMLATDADYDIVRDYIEAGGLTLDDIVAILETED